MASRWRVMGENGSSNIGTTMKTSCRAVVNADNRRGHRRHPSNKVTSKSSPISYFLNVSITTNKSRALNESKTKFRIKIPKVLAKTVKKKELQCETNGTTTVKPCDNVKPTTKWANAKMLLHVNKVTSLFSSFKKPECTSVLDRCESISSNNSCNIGRKIEDGHHQDSFIDKYEIEDEEEEEEEEENKGIFNKSSIGQMEESDSGESSASFKSVTSFKSMTSSLFSLNINGDYGYFSEPNSPPLSDFIHHPKENSKIKKKKEYDDEVPIGFNGSCGSTFRLPVKASTSFKSFLNKKTTHLSFVNKGSTSTSGSNNSICRSEDGGNEEIKGEVRHESCGNDQKRTWKNGITGMKVVNRKKKTESDDKELWKKRILMGEKCRPLNISEFIEPPPHSPR